MNEDQWYFAYGSNLLIDQKVERTGQIRQAVLCCLEGFRFAFNKRGSGGQIYANIIPDDNARVWGVIYLCDPKAIEEMDRYEGVSSGHYERVLVVVTNDSGQSIEAIAYIAGEDFLCDPGKPKAVYLKKIVTGARYHELPEAYIKSIELLAK